jgi:hypothetical protein
VLTRDIAERGYEGTIRCCGSGERDGAGAIHEGRHRGFDCGHGVGCGEMNQVCHAGVAIQALKGAVAIVAPTVRMNDTRQAELAVIARAAATELATLWPLRSKLKLVAARRPPTGSRINKTSKGIEPLEAVALPATIYSYGSITVLLT